MKLGLIFVGAIRECLDDIKTNIQALKDCFPTHDVEVIFLTWYPKKGTYSNHKVNEGANYLYDYDINLLNEQIKDVVDIPIFLEQKDMSQYHQCRDDGFPFFAYNLIYIAKYLKENNKKYDYIIRSRHDNFVRIKDAEKFFNENANVSPCFHIGDKQFNRTETSSHFFITSYNNFLKLKDLSDDQIKHFCENSVNNEQFDAHMLNHIAGNIEFIEPSDFLNFRNRRLSFRVWV